MGTITILPETPKDPLALIGRRAGICWNADIINEEKNIKRGIDCIKSGHGRTLEFVDVHMIIDGFSARVMREYYRHVGGMTPYLQASISIIKTLILLYQNQSKKIQMLWLNLTQLLVSLEIHSSSFKIWVSQMRMQRIFFHLV